MENLFRRLLDDSTLHTYNLAVYNKKRLTNLSTILIFISAAKEIINRREHVSYKLYIRSFT